ncbi:hypothetical protein [Microvirga mediterraneensis]|uniref:Uncharacterized protein n=1 Tax=Microvirga mediterraneensis TaxID=2754695 RepID=A0A838BN85_9HYPH|nr:hypothetical protein [Microvirga mediterraneensis]MBA1157164.1 hypothetical protein [Microvirga mediterraneensis]
MGHIVLPGDSVFDDLADLRPVGRAHASEQEGFRGSARVSMNKLSELDMKTQEID